MAHLKSLLALAPLTLSLTAQTPVINNVFNGSSGNPGPIAPGEQVIVSGSNLGDSTSVACGNATTPVPTVCGGVSVLVNGKAALVRNESSQAVSVFVPLDVTGPATFQLTRQTGSQTLQSNVFSNVAVAATAPGLAAGNFQDPAGNLITSLNPAKPGDFVKAVGTGFGVTNPPAPLGNTVPPSPPYNVVALVKVTVGGQNAVVSSATLVPGALGANDQVIFQVPAGLNGGNQPVVVNVGGVNSQTVQLAVAFVGPRVTSVVNSASNAVAGFPNAGVAPGSIIVVYGNSLGPDTLTLAPGYPWPATLSGTSAQITVAGKSTSLLLYYTSASQIAGLLPSGTPPGNGSITVTFNGQTGSPSAITVLQNNFGVYTVPQNGTGPGIVTFADYSLVSTTRAANPGETLIIWGTGLGAVNGDEAAGPLPGDMTNLPVQVWVAGVSATVVYRGRSGCCVGEDQIAFVVPPNLTGCNVPLAVQINNQVSNYSTIALAPNGRACVPANNNIPPGSTTVAQPRVLIGEFKRVLNPPPQSPNDQPSFDGATIDGLKVGASAQEINIAIDGPPVGSCLVFPGNPKGYDPPFLGILDAGPALSLKGPAGTTRTIGKSGFEYTANLGNTSPGNFLDPGAYTLTGTGGADIGAFTAAFSIPAFTWTNRPAGANAFTINRSQGAKFNWTGGDPNGFTQIFGGSGISNTQFNNFICQVRTADGTFTVPPSVLLAMPAGFGNISIEHDTAYTTFTASGVDFAGILSGYNIAAPAMFQ